MLMNKDGTPFQLSNLRAFNPNNVEKDLFNSIDAEAIQINGTPIFYYEVFIDSNSIDPLLHEARSKVWSPIPICLYASYDPVISEIFMTPYGADGPTEVVFELNHKAVLDALGHLPKIGSMIFTPHKNEHWIIKDRKLSDWKNWHQLRLQLECGRFQESKTTEDGMATDRRQPTRIDIN